MCRIYYFIVSFRRLLMSNAVLNNFTEVERMRVVKIKADHLYNGFFDGDSFALNAISYV